MPGIGLKAAQQIADAVLAHGRRLDLAPLAVAVLDERGVLKVLTDASDDHGGDAVGDDVGGRNDALGEDGDGQVVRAWSWRRGRGGMAVPGHGVVLSRWEAL